jgi:TRAP transporter TAXI family solute receptor
MLSWIRTGALLVSFAGFVSACAAADVPYKIVTASERGTYIQIGRDLAKYVAPDAEIDLQVLPSAGSSENVKRLRYEPGVKLALVQSDVYQALLDQGDGGNKVANALIRPLRVVLPLYNEEIYFITRADSKLEYVHQIKDTRINVGPLLSGTAMSATTLYKLMFNAPITQTKVTYLSNEDALAKLTEDKSIDVVVVVAGQPAKLLADMKPEARNLIKLLKFDANIAEGQAALKTYFAATVRASSYPNLLSEDLPGIAVRAYLVTYDYTSGTTAPHLSKFARSLCQNFTKLQIDGHPKWHEVELAMPPLGRGWAYYPPTARELQACASFTPSAAPPPAQVKATPKGSCTHDERVLGLCP